MSTAQSVPLLGLSGSLRKDSYATAILKTLAEAIRPHAEITLGDIGLLPHYNADQDGPHSPPSVLAMRAMLASSAGLVIVSPEYSHSMTGVLKNALDWLSSSVVTSPMPGKPVLIITSSPALTGGVRAQAVLRETLFAAGARPIGVNEVLITNAHTKVTDGHLVDKASLDHALKALQQLITVIQAMPR